MNLIRIDEKILLDSKSIVSVGRNKNDLLEFCQRYNVVDKIRYFLTDNKREQKDITINGITISSGDFSFASDLFGSNNIEKSILVIMDDYYRELYELICEWPVFAERRDAVRIYYYLNTENEIENEYREKYLEKSLENIIVFRSGPHASQYIHGMDFADNARALFEYMLEKKINVSYELVWLVKDPKEFDRFSEFENVSFLSFEWAREGTREQMDAYYRVLCLAKFFFFTDAYGFVRNCRIDQIRVQLWHGCGFKTRVNFTRCERRYELMPVVSEVYKEIHKKIYGLRDDQVIVTGYPKEDWMFHPVKDSFVDLFDAPATPKYILWLPTFRETNDSLSNLSEHTNVGETGLLIVDSRKKLETLNNLLALKQVTLLIKLHPFQKRSVIDCSGFSNIIPIENEDLIKKDIPINRLMGKVDALISDYSSAAIDYLILDRPIGFVLEDLEKYGNSRGFVFEPIRDYIPGTEIFSFENFLNFISEIADGVDSNKEKRTRIRNKLHSFFDDNNCKRLVDYLGIS